MDRETQSIEPKPTSGHWRRISLTLVICGVLAILFFGGLFVYGKSYSGRVHPGLHVGSISIGGMNEIELREYLRTMTDKLMNDNLDFIFESPVESHAFSMYPVITDGDNVIELVAIDIEAEVKRLMNYGKEYGPIAAAISAFYSQVAEPNITLSSVKADKERIISRLAEEVTRDERGPRDASIKIISLNPVKYEVTSSSPGLVFRYDQVVGQIMAAWSRLESPTFTIRQEMVPPAVLESDIALVQDQIGPFLAGGSLSITYADPVIAKSRDWVIKPEVFKDWISVQKSEDSEPRLSLKRSEVESYLDKNVTKVVTVEARDAKFSIDDSGKVTEFQGSRPGVTVDVEGMHQRLNQFVSDRINQQATSTSKVELAVQTVEPNITTGEVNNLGIKEILGVGISNFSGSPTNRIKNIRNAVNKLNGVLIKPGEEFSTITYTQPYTLEGGYLPELVIKGDEITPEIGGGLCQIGTTLFRMAMNSGMPILERRNHSLVVSYYNDLDNGLPGTDATVYEPAPDFRFKNDTGGHILIQTEMNVNTGFLHFTLWGTGDGRVGAYDKPVVKKWLPHGPTKIIETTKLAPGVKNCQHAYTGAQTAFTYTRTLPDGTKEEQVFESYYRPLPEICLVGVAELTQCQILPDGGNSCASNGAAEPENQFNPDGSPIPLIVE